MEMDILGIRYIWFKLITKIKGCAVKNSYLSKDSKLEAGTTFINSELGRFSYCGYNCYIVNVDIGAFCSLSDNISIGGGVHPLDWVSTSPAFYRGRDSISKRLARLDFSTEDPRTIIGNDVWIGRGAYIKAGVTVGDGAVIGMGSVVTKDVAAYSIVAGNPAVEIRKRFDLETIERIHKSLWWKLEEDNIVKYADKMNNVEAFIKEITTKKL